MQITVRLDPLLEKKISLLSKKRLCTKSQIIKESLNRYFEKEFYRPSPYELWKEVFKGTRSGRSDLSTNKQLLKKKIRAKN